MSNTNVPFLNISSKFIQTFCPICQQASECPMHAVHYETTSVATFNVYK